MFNIADFFTKQGVRIYHRMEMNTEYAQRKMVAFSLLMALNFPIYLLVEYCVHPLHYHSGGLQLSASILCVILLLKDFWPRFLKKLLPLYWYVVICFTLPFFFMYTRDHSKCLIF